MYLSSIEMGRDVGRAERQENCLLQGRLEDAAGSVTVQTVSGKLQGFVIGLSSSKISRPVLVRFKQHQPKQASIHPARRRFSFSFFHSMSMGCCCTYSCAVDVSLLEKQHPLESICRDGIVLTLMSGPMIRPDHQKPVIPSPPFSRQAVEYVARMLHGGNDTSAVKREQVPGSGGRIGGGALGCGGLVKAAEGRWQLPGRDLWVNPCNELKPEKYLNMGRHINGRPRPLCEKKVIRPAAVPTDHPAPFHSAQPTLGWPPHKRTYHLQQHQGAAVAAVTADQNLKSHILSLPNPDARPLLGLKSRARSTSIREAPCNISTYPHHQQQHGT